MDLLEFKSRFWAIKKIKFHPPTWEEFLKTRSSEQFAHWFFYDYHIVMCERNDKKGVLRTFNRFEFTMSIDSSFFDRNFDYVFEYGLDNREEVYYRVLEYVQNLFLQMPFSLT